MIIVLEYQKCLFEGKFCQKTDSLMKKVVFPGEESKVL